MSQCPERQQQQNTAKQSGVSAAEVSLSKALTPLHPRHVFLWPADWITTTCGDTEASQRSRWILQVALTPKKTKQVAWSWADFSRCLCKPERVWRALTSSFCLVSLLFFMGICLFFYFHFILFSGFLMCFLPVAFIFACRSSLWFPSNKTRAAIQREPGLDPRHKTHTKAGRWPPAVS